MQHAEIELLAIRRAQTVRTVARVDLAIEARRQARAELPRVEEKEPLSEVIEAAPGQGVMQQVEFLSVPPLRFTAPVDVTATV